MATSKAELARRLRNLIRADLWARDDLTPTEKLLALALTEHTDYQGNVKISSPKLAKDTSLSLRNVGYLRNTLREKGILCDANGPRKQGKVVGERLLTYATIAHPTYATIAGVQPLTYATIAQVETKVFTRPRARGLKPSILQTGGRAHESKTVPAFTKGEIEEKRAAAQKAINEAKDILLVAKKNLHRQAD